MRFVVVTILVKPVSVSTAGDEYISTRMYYVIAKTIDAGIT